MRRRLGIGARISRLGAQGTSRRLIGWAGYFSVASILTVGCGGGSSLDAVLGQQFDAPNDRGAPSLYGTWISSDGTGRKILHEDGRCQGFFYVSKTGEPLDIGGPMSCQLSSKTDSSGRYQLAVTQSPNSATYLVEFDGTDAASVYTQSGKLLYQLSRF